MLRAGSTRRSKTRSPYARPPARAEVPVARPSQPRNSSLTSARPTQQHQSSQSTLSADIHQDAPGVIPLHTTQPTITPDVYLQGNARPAVAIPTENVPHQTVRM